MQSKHQTQSLGQKFICIICSLVLCITFLPTCTLSAFADEGDSGEATAIKEGDIIKCDVEFQPTDESSSQTSVTLNFYVAKYDEDTKTGNAYVGAGKEDGDALNGNVAGKIIIPETVTYEDSTLTVVAINANAFCGRENVTGVTMPNTIETIGEKAFFGCHLEKLVIPKSVKKIGRYLQGGSATSPYAVPVIEWQGNCSEIQHSNDGEMFLGNASSGKQVNHIFWGDPGLASSYESDMRVGPVCNSTTAKNKNAIEPGYKSSDKATPSSYVWFPVTFYKNQEDAVNEMNAIGTAYISASTLQTNSTTVEYSKLKDSRTTYGDVVNMTLKRDGDTTESGNSYFLNYNDGTHKTLTDYPAFEGDADKWIILGGADLSAKIAQGFSCYSVKADPNDLSQGYVTGLKSSYSATGKDIEPSVTVYNSNNEVVSAENYTISYQRKEGSNWVDRKSVV